ncbi:MAG: hypothetical protein ACRC0G_08420 [Fusobacteriaceae bacterium]
MASKNLSQLFMQRVKSMNAESEEDFHITLRPYQREAKEMIFAENEMRPAYISWCRRAG